jgi:hypothetical protein
MLLFVLYLLIIKEYFHRTHTKLKSLQRSCEGEGRPNLFSEATQAGEG